MKNSGLPCYRTNDGIVLWQRRDLKRVQKLNFGYRDSVLLAVFSDRPGHILDSVTGKTQRTVRGAEECLCVSPYQKIEAIGTRTKFVLSGPVLKKETVRLALSGDMVGMRYERGTGKEIPPLERRRVKRFSVLHAVFSKDAIFVSGMGGPLSAFSTEDGALLWRYECPSKSHFLQLGFTEEGNTLWGFLYYYSGPEQQKQKLIAFEPKAGDLRSDTAVDDCFGCRFALRGRILVTNPGNIYDLSDSSNPKIIAHLDFS